MRKLLKGALVAIGLMMAGTAASAETWTAYTFGVSDQLASVKGLKAILDEIEQESDGELKFRLRIAGALPIQATNITQAVGNGTVKFADDGFHLGNVKVAGIMRLPMLIQTPEEYDAAIEVLWPHIEREFERQGALMLGMTRFPHQVAFSTKPLTSLADLAGQKMRVSSPEQAAFVERLGGIPVTMGGAEVPSAMQAGTIDGVFTASVGGGRVWADMLKSNYRIPAGYFDAYYIVNKAAFEALTPELQEIVRNAVINQSPLTTARMDAEEIEITDMLRANGMAIHEASTQDIEVATRQFAPFWDEWAAAQGGGAVAALAEVRKAIGR